MRDRLPLTLLGAFFLVMVALQVRSTLMFASLHLAPQQVAQLPANVMSQRSLRLYALTDAVKKAGVHEGDKLLAIDGQTMTSAMEVGRTILSRRPGDTVRLKLRPDKGDAYEVAYPLPPVSTTPPPWQEWVLDTILAVFTPWLCLLLGFFVAFRRPRDPLAILLLFLLVGLPNLYANYGNYRMGWDTIFSVPMMFLSTFTARFVAVAWLWFAILFPNPAAPRLLPWTRWAIGIPLTAWALFQGIGYAGIYHAPVAFNYWPNATNAVPNSLVTILFGSALVLGFANIFYKLLCERDRAARRRLKILLIGLALGMAPLTAILAYSYATGYQPASQQRLLATAACAVILVPLTLAYVVLFQKALDVGVAVRQGLQYALASGLARLLSIGLAALLIMALLLARGQADWSDTAKTWLLLPVVAGVLGIRKFARQLQEWVDRRFFREAVNTEQVLGSLSEEVHRMVEPHALLELVARRIGDTLHVPRVAALLADGDEYRPATAYGFGAQVPSVTFAQSSPAVEKLRATRAPLTVYLSDPQSWVHHEAAADREHLTALATELLLPLSAKDKLLGFLSLGPKQSELAYSPSDLRLLQYLASQTGLALENSHLARAIADESAQRERLHRELEIAREVQERLFPKAAPQVNGLTVAGRCLPAQTIGGDYFDFLSTPGGELGLAIGDVAGKGIPAALMMSSLHASLRGLTVDGVADLGALMTKLNRLMFDATPANRFITFFCGFFDPATRRFRYACAGHNPALLVRAGGELEWLRARGVGLALTKAARFQQAEVLLAPGDRLVLYTDGVTEAQGGGEEFGEERLASLARQPGTAAQTVDAIVSAAAGFSGTAERHDDITVIVAQA